MSGRTVNSAILLLILGNALAIGSDVVIKLTGPDVPVFQFVFMRNLTTVLMLLPLFHRIDRSRLFQGVGVHLLRAHVGMVGIACMVVALHSLPLATANALFYAAPVLVMVLSVVLLREHLSGVSLLAVVSGFAGIVVILRPVAFDWSALSALAVAAALAVGALLVRKLPEKQSLIHSLFLNYLLVLPASFTLALVEAAPWRWDLVLSAFGSSFLIVGYNMTVLRAYRHVAANQVTSAEYTGLIWAVLIGWIGFGEVPDLWFVAGSLMIIGPLVWLGLQHRRGRRAQALASSG